MRLVSSTNFRNTHSISVVIFDDKGNMPHPIKRYRHEVDQEKLSNVQ